MLPVLLHAIDALSGSGWTPDIVVILQPTSPLRRGEHIRDADRLLRESGADSVVTVVEVPKHLSPDYVMRIENGRLRTFLPEGARVRKPGTAAVAQAWMSKWAAGLPGIYPIA
jgi:N-acylneuraminate cytidylyltransferase